MEPLLIDFGSCFASDNRRLIGIRIRIEYVPCGAAKAFRLVSLG